LSDGVIPTKEQEEEFYLLVDQFNEKNYGTDCPIQKKLVCENQ
jgi:hypothetical protein